MGSYLADLGHIVLLCSLNRGRDKQASNTTESPHHTPHQFNFISRPRRMAKEQTEPAAFVTHYLQARGPEIAGIHDAWAVDSSFNESKSKYEAKEKHEYAQFHSPTGYP